MDCFNLNVGNFNLLVICYYFMLHLITFSITISLVQLVFYEQHFYNAL